MYDMSVVLERDKLPVALATVLSEDLPSSPDDRAEYCRAHLMHGSRLALEGIVVCEPAEAIDLKIMRRARLLPPCRDESL